LHGQKGLAEMGRFASRTGCGTSFRHADEKDQNALGIKNVAMMQKCDIKKRARHSFRYASEENCAAKFNLKNQRKSLI
jgi:hypothetical protein